LRLARREQGGEINAFRHALQRRCDAAVPVASAPGSGVPDVVNLKSLRSRVMEANESRTRPLDQLKWALQALALDAEQQVRLLPPFVCVGDELALDFDDGHRVACADHAFTAEQRAALAAVDECLANMTAENDKALWQGGEVLASHPDWQEARRRARAALRAFGWPLEVPPGDRAIYVAQP
jgi:hypothetical protein